MKSTDDVVFHNTKKYIELGYSIVYYSKHANLTQKLIAEKPGISRQHLSAIEAPNLLRSIFLKLCLILQRF